MTALLALALATPVIFLFLLMAMAWTEQRLDRSDVADVADVTPLERVPVHVQPQQDVPNDGLVLTPQRA